MTRFLLALILGVTSIGAQGATVVLDDTTATKIEGLNVGGNTYNVSFLGGSYDGLDTGNQFPFVGDSIGGEDARDAILNALNDVMALYVGESKTSRVNSFLVPYSVNGGFVTVEIGSWGNPVAGSWADGGTTSYPVAADQLGVGNSKYAVFAAVPIPATSWLFGSAISLMPLIRRKLWRG